MIPYIDMHCDTLMRAYMEKKNSIYELPELMLDVRRLAQGGASAQFFAIFMLPESMREKLKDAFPEDRDYIEVLLTVYERTLAEHGDCIGRCAELKDYLDNQKEGKVNAILSVEDGRAVAGELENLRWLRSKGVRMMAPLWNYANCFGYPNSDSPAVMQKRLTSFGKEAIAVMNDLGMIFDVSHLSDGGFWDVAKLSKKPFVASHSNCRALSPHRRNLSDEMIRALAEKGGVMGLNFYGPFLNRDTTCMESRIPQMLAHLKHMIKVGGSDLPAMGTDFDGMEGDFEISECSKMQLLFEAMEREGFTMEEIEKIAYKNVERVIKEVF